jgi:hypothetical protein
MTSFEGQLRIDPLRIDPSNRCRERIDVNVLGNEGSTEEMCRAEKLKESPQKVHESQHANHRDQAGWRRLHFMCFFFRPWSDPCVATDKESNVLSIGGRNSSRLVSDGSLWRSGHKEFQPVK